MNSVETLSQAHPVPTAVPELRSRPREESSPPLSHGGTDWTIPQELLPDIENLIIEDGAPLDGIEQEREMHLLVDSVHSSWQGPGDGRSFVALANVGVFIGSLFRQSYRTCS